MSVVKDRKGYIPLAPFEVSLLENACQIPATDDDDDAKAACQALFDKWLWSHRVNEHFKAHWNPEELEIEFEGDLERAYRNCLHWLSHKGVLKQSLFRVNAFRNLNTEFFGLLETCPSESIEFALAPSDYKAWTILLALEQLGQLHFSREWFAGKRSLDIFRSIFHYHHCFLNPPDPQDRVQFLVALSEQWGVKLASAVDDAAENDRPTHDRTQRYLFRSKQEAPTEWPKGKANTNRDGLLTDKYIIHLLKKVDAQSWLEGVIENVPIIAFGELQHVSAAELQDAGINLSIPFAERENFENLRWMLWKPKSSSTIDTHLLHTEDEVYQYCVLNNWCFPDHLHEDRVIFAVRPLKNSDFVSELKQFWVSWNDCCVSWDPRLEQVCLLETIPGLRFRARAKYEDMEVALRYYRNIVEAHAAGRLHDTAMRDLLGKEFYNTLFTHSLQYIPEDQIVLEKLSFLGEGRNGRVYQATWHRSPAVLETSQQGEAVEVALKAIKLTGARAKFMQELDLTYSSMGAGVGCIELYGISTIPASIMEPQTSTESAVSQDRTIVLVSKYANQGCIRDYLKTKLPQTSWAASWRLVIDMLSCITNGLNTLHRHDVIHRDLHLNNILVTRTHFPNEPIHMSIEDSAKVTDIGEGRHIVAQLPTAAFNASVEARDFHAPEVISMRRWSKASDVFAFGVAACKLLDLRAQLCPEKASDVGMDQIVDAISDTAIDINSSTTNARWIVPSVMSDVVCSALAREPTERRPSREYVAKLDNLSMDFFYEKEDPEDKRVEWTTLSWWEVFEKAYRRGEDGGSYRQHDKGAEESSTWTRPEDTPAS